LKQMYEVWIAVRSVVIWFIALLMLFIVVCLAILSYPFRLYHFVHILAETYARFVLFISGVRFRISGIENLEETGPFIVVSNHQSMFDAVAMYTFLEIPFRWVAKASLFRIPFLGLAMKAGGYISVERDQPRKAAVSLLEAARGVNSGISVVIFPEGTRSFEDGSMRPFKNGSFLLAKKAKVTLQPVVFWGSHKIIPVKRKKLFQKIYPGKVFISIIKPIHPDDYSSLEVDEISDLIRTKMQISLDQMKLESQKA